MVAGDMVALGAYRVQVNRGGGILHAYLARDCVRSAAAAAGQSWENDYEKQTVALFTRADLVKAVLRGEVGEAQWLATAAIGLLYEEHH